MRYLLLFILLLFTEMSRASVNHTSSVNLTSCQLTYPSLSDTLPEKSDTSLVITIKEFNSTIDMLIKLLRTKKTTSFTDLEHRQIILCINTPKSNEGHFQEFSNLIINTNYCSSLLMIYPDWLPSLGLGYYFPELKIGLGGAPNPKYRYRVLN